MTPFATLVVGSAASLLLAANTPALAGSTHADPAHSVALVCDDGPDTGFCRMLADVLSAAAKGRTFVVTDAATAPAEGPVLRFVAERQTETSLAGHLAWTTGDGLTGQGPTLEISVIDSFLTSDLLRTYAAQLVQYSTVPL